jgi:hypothetical protein
MLAAMGCLAGLGGCGNAKEVGNFPPLPSSVAGWTASGKDKIFDRNTLYDYIDGGAEVYLAYGFRQLLARRFGREKQPGITVDVFDMGSAAEAFGVFSFERLGPHAGIGQDSEYSSGLLRFWKGRFFVAVTAEHETPEAREAVLEAGRRVAQAIEQTGARPELLRLLPRRGLQPLTIRFFHLYSSLTYHCFIAEDNILGLGPDTDVVLARYVLGEAEGRGEHGAGGAGAAQPAQAVAPKARLLLVKYPDEARAREAKERFLQSYLPHADAQGLGQTEDGKWCGVAWVGEHLFIALEARQRGEARDLLEAALKRLGGE